MASANMWLGLVLLFSALMEELRNSGCVYGTAQLMAALHKLHPDLDVFPEEGQDKYGPLSWYF